MSRGCVLLTRTQEANFLMAPAFRAIGLDVLDAPMIQLVDIPPDSARLSCLDGDEPVILTSHNAAKRWRTLRSNGSIVHSPRSYYLVGERALNALDGLDPDVPRQTISGSAAELLEVGLVSADGRPIHRVLYPCSASRLDTLSQGLHRLGIEVMEVVLYSPMPVETAPRDIARAFDAAISPLVIPFFSPSAVAMFFNVSGNIPDGAIFAAIGPSTADALAEHVALPIIVPERYTLRHLVAAVDAYISAL